MIENNNYTKLLNHHSAQKTHKLIVLGVSGSVGQSCVQFLKTDPTIELVAVSVHAGVEKLRQILNEVAVKNVAISSESVYKAHIASLKNEHPDTVFFCGQKGVLEMIQRAHDIDQADTILTAVVGAIGINATILSLELGLKIALANKETMVTAGPAIQYLVASLAKKSRKIPVILPVDSEHNAVFLLLSGLRADHIDRVILTASGGPFRDLEAKELAGVSKEQVLNHPTWSMGPKITVDSAGMINKGLEIIEAHFLFNLPYQKLDVLIHPDSIVHAMVATRDGGFLMNASQPNMIFPIAHSLYYPESVERPHSFASNPDVWPNLSFKKVDTEKYRGFGIALEAGKQGGTAPAIFNAANEVAVDLFLDGVIDFIKIPDLLDQVLQNSNIINSIDLNDYLEADIRARQMCLVYGKKNV